MMIMKRIKTDCTGITESAGQDDEKVVTTSMEVKSEEHEESEGKKKAVMTRVVTKLLSPENEKKSVRS